MRNRFFHRFDGQRRGTAFRAMLVASAMLLNSPAPADPPAPEAVAEPRKPMIFAEQLEAWERAEREEMMKSFRASGARDEQRDKVYTALIGNYIHASVRETIDKQADKLRDSSISAIRAGYDDPVARMLLLEANLSLARAAKKPPRSQDIENAEKAIAVLKQRGYPPVRLWKWARVISIAKAAAKEDRSEVAASIRAGEDAFVSAAAAASNDPFMEQYLVRLLTADLEDATAPHYTKNFIRALDDSSASPWMKGTAGGIWHAENAWTLRGDDDDTNDAQQAGFEEQLDLAEVRLTDAFRTDSTRPEPASRMIQVRGGHKDQDGMARWFELATAAQFDYIRAYDTMTWFLRPRWSGSYEKMFALAERCLASERFDTLVPGRYLKLTSAIAADKEDFGDALSHARVPESLDRIRKGYANRDFGGAHFARSQVAVCYWRMGRFSDALALYCELGEHFDSTALSQWRVLYDEFSVVYAYAPETRDLVQSADKAVQDGHPESAPDMLQEALSTATNDSARRAIRMKLAMNRFDTQYGSGEWTPLAPDPDAALLFTVGRVNQGWEFKPENKVTVNPKPWYAMTVFLPRLGRDWEVRGNVIVAPGSDNQDFGAGVSLYVNTDAAAMWDSWTWQDVLVFPELRLWRLGPPYEDKKPLNVGASRYSIRAQCWKSEIVIKIDGEIVLAGEQPFSARRAAADRIGLHVMDCTPRPDAVTFDGFEVRKLQQRPADLQKEELNHRKKTRVKF